MATKSAGRVSIRVLPDSTRFKKDLETALRRIERQLKAKIQAELELSREQLAKLKRQIESLVVKIKPTIELNISQADLEELKAKIERMKPTVDVNLNTIVASRRIESLTRTRTMTIIPVFAKAGLASLGKKLQGLAGLNVVEGMFREGITFFQQIDQNAVKLGAVYTKVATMAGALGAAAASSLVLSSNLASIGNLALLGPAFLTGLGISIGVAVVALKDMKTRLADLGPAFTDLQDKISNGFWEQAEKPVRNLVKALLPSLREQLVKTGQAMGGIFGDVAKAIQENVSPEYLERVFGRMNSALNGGRRAIGPFIHAFAVLGDTGSKYFGRFSDWIVKLSIDFDKFISDAAKDGRLDKWINNAIDNTKALGQTIRGVTRIFSGLAAAAEKSGSLNLTDLGDSLNKAADVVNTPRFQRTLITIFSGMNDAVAGIGRGLAALGPAIESAAPSIERVFGTVGRIAEGVGGMLASIVSNPNVQKGFESFFLGIEAGLKALEPAMKPFGDSLGGALRLLGTMAEAVGGIVSTIITVLGPELDKMGAEFEKLIEPLGNSIKNFVEKLGPLLGTLNTEVVKPLVSLIKEEVIPLFDKVVNFLAPSVKVVLEELGKFIKDDLTPLFKALNGEMDKTTGKEDDFAESLKKTIENITNFLNTISDPKKLMPGFNGNWLGGLFTGQADNFMKDWENFKRPINEWWNNVVWPGFEGMILDGLKGFESWGKDTFAPAVKAAWATFWDELMRILTGRPSKGTEEKNKKNWEDFWDGVGQNIEDAYNGFKTWFQQWLKDINPWDDLFEQLFGDPSKPTPGAGGGKGSMGAGAKIGPNFFDEEAEKTWIDGLITRIGEKIGGMGAIIGASVETIKASGGVAWTNFWSGLGVSAETPMATATTNISLKLVEIGLGIGTFVTENAPKWATFFTTASTEANTGMTLSATSVSTKLVEMGLGIATFVTTNAPIWSAAFAGFSAVATEKWGEISRNTTTNLATVAMEIVTKTGIMKGNMSTGFAGIVTSVVAGWLNVSREFQTGVNNAVTIAKTLGGLVIAALDSVDLSASGARIASSLATGMSSNQHLVATAASALVAEIARHMPHSPAKVGPLSGLGYTTHSGRALVKDFAGGMMDNMAKVRSATKAVAEAASLGANMDLTTDLDKDGVVIDRREVNMHVYNPVREATSRTIETASNKLRMAKAI